MLILDPKRGISENSYNRLNLFSNPMNCGVIKSQCTRLLLALNGQNCISKYETF